MDPAVRNLSCVQADIHDTKKELERRTGSLRGNVDRLFDQLLEAVQARRRSVLAQITCVEQQLKTEIIQEEAVLQRVADATEKSSESLSARQLNEQISHAKASVRNVKQYLESLDYRGDVSELCSELLAFGEVTGCPVAAESKHGKCACSARPRRIASCAPSCAPACCNEKAALVSSYFDQDVATTCVSVPAKTSAVSSPKPAPSASRQPSTYDTDETLQTMRRIRELPLIFWMPISVAPKTERDPRIDENLITFKRLREAPLSDWLLNTSTEKSSADMLVASIPVTQPLVASAPRYVATPPRTPDSERSLSVSSESTDGSDFEVIAGIMAKN